MPDVTLTAALIAGLVSFLSPCVLPLVPPYLVYLTGATLDDLADTEANPALVRRAVLLELVFVAMGASASMIGHYVRVYSASLSMVAGVVIIIMGLHFLGLFRIPLLYRQAKIDMAPPKAGPVGAYLMGLAFAFGWTPCIGPVLAAILAVAASEVTIHKGAGLLAVYSLGLGIPFVLAAFAIKPFLRFAAAIRHRLRVVEMVMGGLLVLTGLAFLTGKMSTVAFWLLETFPALGSIG
ncbi:MAG: cytochrome c-type bioproteinis protein [Xanthobacteraceae bacterium]|nr:MAG: cytochrome c-type bioproteinis protein [Xanthobacteraceae bacterium]